MLYRISIAFRFMARLVAVPIIVFLLPLKLFAWRTRIRWLRRLILELTTLADFLIVLGTIQNRAMRLHHRVWRGNFPFGKALMVVDHDRAGHEIAQPTLRGNRFMGIDVVSNDPGAFVTNAGPICTGQPVRRMQREYMDTRIMTDRVRALDLDTLKKLCAPILAEWADSHGMANVWEIRGVVTRLFLKILAEETLPKDEIDRITKNYVRRFAELSLFGRYLPSMLGFLGTREHIRRDCFIPLRKAGIDNLIIDMTLFAAMFSIGTIVIKCVGFTREYRIDYLSLTPAERIGFVIESQRHFPTVTSVHRIVEEEETVEVRGRPVNLFPGDEVAYPFILINRDPKHFLNPGSFRIDRPEEEMDKVMSWSVGPHRCPAKELSILVTVAMLDNLAQRHDLPSLRIFSPEF